MTQQWIYVKTKQGYVGQVLIDISLPFDDQVSDQVIWMGWDAPEESHAGQAIFWLAVYLLALIAIWVGGL